MTVFSSPVIEGTLNIMGDIMTEERTSLSIENYEATAIIQACYSSGNSRISGKTTFWFRGCSGELKNLREKKKFGSDVTPRSKMRNSQTCLLFFKTTQLRIFV